MSWSKIILERPNNFGQVLNRFGCVQFHTTYIRNNIGQKCEGNCGLWVLNEMLKRSYPEYLKKIVGAV